MIAREHIYIITRYILRASPHRTTPPLQRAPQKGEKCLKKRSKQGEPIESPATTLNSKQKFVPQLNCNKKQNNTKSYLEID